jgi:exopolyphosphatase / guanosine-5'-triphosphate,3'-diphosphate pyrophosphatase
VTDVSSRVDGETLVLEVTGAPDRELEEWTVRAKAGLLKEAMGLDVRIVDGATRTQRGSNPPTPTVRSME